ncbi:SUMF1/EgtB/PvdO family nonheme iron enzyme [Okeania hirsuta]|uniref:SUMF1/EgtB/PvdO family nonheme iron enzyme n=1 Tax=Okeania hirsuta TaxID=1458930 RepID=UPI0035C8A657
MMPFNPFCRQIINSWQEANIYYFDNVPKIRIYADPDFSEKKSLKTLLSELVKEEILVLILSDGGAARGRFVSERVEKTENFLKFLSRKVERVAWLNPLPRHKWCGTSAEEISAISNDNFNLKMFGLNYQEFKGMSQWLISGKLGINLPVVKTDVEEVEIVNENLDQIAAFTEYFGEPHLIFAQHAAFPLALTPDLLYRLWQRFFARQRNFNIPWYAVADILLSSFCHAVDRELYEMDRGIRNQLLQLCTERFGQSRLEELSQFLVSYIDSQVNRGESVSSIWQGQRWTALAYTRPELAARQLAESLQEAYGRDDKAELVRLSSLMETLAEPLREYEPLLVILGQGYGGYARGDVAGVENVRRELGKSEVDVGGVLLRVPVALPLQTFSFEVVTVNRKGEEINRVSREAKFFTEDLGNGVILEMVAIPGGTFIMGSPESEEGRLDQESPQHEITLQPFYMSKYPITQEQYQAIIGENPSHFKGRNRPVEMVTWHNATEFCQQLSKKTRKNYRLPSESQWEYACRAGTTTPFYFGETITTDLVNYNGYDTYGNAPQGRYREQTTDVGSFPPNAFGLFDLHGNVWEWCHDIWHDNYEGVPNDGRAWIDSNEGEKINNENDLDSHSNDEKELYSVLRGGSWGDFFMSCRSAIRSYSVRRGYRHNYHGIRVVVCSSIEFLTNYGDSTPNIQQRQKPIILPNNNLENLLLKPSGTSQAKLPLKTFSFEVVKVNRRGEEINRVWREAEFFTEDLGNGVILEMVAIPGGSFIMGSPENEAQRRDTESPQHEITLQPFYMSKYPITQEQYQAIIGENPSHFKGRNRPVEMVTWHNATEFCQQLSKKTRKNYRLPSESQWEYACRAGTTTPFYFGETITTDLVNYNGNYTYGNASRGKYREQTTDVGSFPPNAFGLYDMHGNVWELCANLGIFPSYADMHGNVWEWWLDIWHHNENNLDSQGNEEEELYPLLRGGSWFNDPDLCRSAFRDYINRRDLCYNNYGFRVVCSSGALINQGASIPNTQQRQQPIILPTTKPESIITPQPKLPLKTFSFEVITVNNRGEKINRVRKQAEYFTEDLGKGLILEMVAIPGGTFMMGSPEDEAGRRDTESPQHGVSLQPFYMSKYPITQNQYQAIMGKNPSYFKGGKRPVERVTWYNATEFCQKLSQKTTKIYKLPSESQWEYACRAGTTTPFYFGETITTDLVNYNGNYTYANAPKGKYRKQTTDVGSFSPNAFGLYDMHGNVWEWCADDWHDNYEDVPTDGTAWVNSHDFQNINNEKELYPLLRGGSWYDNPYVCRSAIRGGSDRQASHVYIFGFRIVCTCINLTLQDDSTPNI